MTTLLLSLLLSPSLAEAASVPPSKVRLSPVLTPLLIEDGKLRTRLSLSAGCTWTYAGRWLRAVADGPCSFAPDIGPRATLTLAAEEPVALGVVPVYGPHAGSVPWQATVTWSANVGMWRHGSDGWELDPLSVVSSALDAILKQPNREPTIEIDVVAQVGGRAADMKYTRYQAKSSAGQQHGAAGGLHAGATARQQVRLPAADLLALSCGSAGPDSPFWEEVARHGSLSLAGVKALKVACPGADPERILCVPLAMRPFALTGEAYSTRLSECAQLTTGVASAADAVWGPVVEGTLAHEGSVPGEDLVALLATVEMDGAKVAAARLRAALASPWTQATAQSPMDGVSAKDLDHPVLGALLTSKATPAGLRAAIEKSAVAVLQAEADAIARQGGHSIDDIDDALRSLQRLQARSKVAGLSLESARRVQPATDGAAKRVAEGLANCWFGLSWGGGNPAALRTLAEARRLTGVAVVDAALRASAERIDTSTGNAFDSLFALADGPSWARDRVAKHLGTRLSEASTAGRPQLEAEITAIEQRHSTVGRPVPDAVVRHPAVAALRAQKEAEAAALGIRPVESYTYLPQGAFARELGMQLHTSPDPQLSESSLLDQIARKWWRNLLDKQVIRNPAEAVLLSARAVAVDTGRWVSGSRSGHLFAMARIVVHGTTRNDFGVLKDVYWSGCTLVDFHTREIVGGRAELVAVGQEKQDYDTYRKAMTVLMFVPAMQLAGDRGGKQPGASARGASGEPRSLTETVFFEIGVVVKGLESSSIGERDTFDSTLDFISAGSGEPGRRVASTCPGIIRALDEVK